MFTLEQIDDIHSRLGSQDTLLAYLCALNDIGVIKADTFLTDGHTIYQGNDGYKVKSESIHEVLDVSDNVDVNLLKLQLKLHKEGKTSYLEMSQGLSGAGVVKWTFDTIKHTITYYDKTGNALYTESIS